MPSELPEVGEVFTAEIDRVSEAGNGIIELNRGHINIGPVADDSAGEIVEAEMLNGIFARCDTEDVKVDDYEEKFETVRGGNATSESHIENESTISETDVDLELITRNHGKSDVHFEGMPRFCDECGSLKTPGDGSWDCPSCDDRTTGEGTTQQKRSVQSADPSQLEHPESSSDKPQQDDTGSGSVSGTVVFFNDVGGYGFLDVPRLDEDVFFHMEDIGGPDLEVGQKLQFEVISTEKGPRAQNAQRVEDVSTATLEEVSPEAQSSGFRTGSSRQEMLNELERIDSSIDHIPSPSDMNEDGAFTACSYRQRFGSWDAALEAVGIDKEAELLEDMQQVAAEAESGLTPSAMTEYGKYSAIMAARFFGSWDEATERFQESESHEELGGEVEDQSEEPISEIEGPLPDRGALLDELEQLDAILDCPPSPSDVAEEGTYSAETYQKVFGSWDNALASVGIDY